MDQLWGDWPSFLFAPPGGGKTAFRVWLTRVCRTGREGRRILPVLLTPPRPESPAALLSWEQYAGALAQSTAVSLLFDLAYQPSQRPVLQAVPSPPYRPSRFLDLEEGARGLLRSLLERDLPIPLGYLLEQMEDEGSLAPLSRTFDPPSLGLPNEPKAESVWAFCAAMRQTAPLPRSQLPEGWEQTVETLQTVLGYQATYVLVDEVDAYVQEPKTIARLLEPLWEKTTAWIHQAVFIKYFLPDAVQPIIPAKMLTEPTKCVIIKWEPETLVQVVRERLRVASEGAFCSLTAISTPNVSEDVEFQLARVLHPPIPREMLRLIQRVFYVHLQRVGPRGWLEQEDYQDALKWYPGRGEQISGLPCEFLLAKSAYRAGEEEASMDGLPLVYYHSHFVDREEPLAVVLDKVRALLRGEPVRNRTTTYHGPRGSGKSWLLRELHHCLQSSAEFADRVVSLFIALGPAPSGKPRDGFQILATEPLETLWRNIAQRLGMGDPPNGCPLDLMTQHVLGGCQRQKCPVVVLVDGIDEMPPQFLRELENHFLAPLSLEPYVLIALGGRTRDPRRYTWKMPELKLYSDEVWLEPFDERWTREQLERLSPDYGVSPAAAPEVLEAGNGYPLSNAVLAEYLEGDPPRWKDRAKALQECADLLLENVDTPLREYFWALCVLRSFDEMRMPPLLAEWSGKPVEEWDYQRCRRIREDMAATRLVRWGGPQGFVMDEAVRAVLENALRENMPGKWRALHQAAYDLFTDWVSRYPTARERWGPEAEYHQQFIR